MRFRTAVVMLLGPHLGTARQTTTSRQWHPAPLIAAVVALPTGGNLLAVYLSSLFWNYAGLYRYEWSHFLIHTPYIPRTRFFRSIWREISGGRKLLAAEA